MSLEIIILRLVHVLGGIFWVGTGMFSAFFLVPALAPMGARAGELFAGLQRRRLYVALPVAALLTIASGIRLMVIVSGGSPAYFASPMGRTYSFAGLMAIVGFLLSMFVSRPAFVRAGQLAASLGAARESDRAAIAKELEQVRRHGAAATTIITVLLLLAAAGMAVGRYVG